MSERRLEGARGHQGGASSPWPPGLVENLRTPDRRQQPRRCCLCAFIRLSGLFLK